VYTIASNQKTATKKITKKMWGLLLMNQLINQKLKIIKKKNDENKSENDENKSENDEYNQLNEKKKKKKL